MVNNDARLVRIVDNVGTYTDQRRWNDLQELFAESVVLDYSSFTGQNAEHLSPKQIIERWAGFLPGFDITQHKMINHAVEARADGSWGVHADVRAFHFIDGVEGGTAWVVDGSYDFTVNQEGRITMMRLNFEKTLGNNDLPNIAIERMKS